MTTTTATPQHGRAHRRVLPTGPGPHRGPGRAVVPRGPDGAVHGRRQSHQVAPGPRHVVLRDVRAGAERARLRALPPGLRVPVQLLLRAGGPAAPAPGPRAADPARRRGGRRVPPPRRRGDGRVPRRAAADDVPRAWSSSASTTSSSTRSCCSWTSSTCCRSTPSARPTATTWPTAPAVADRRAGWVEHPGGLVEIGHDGDGFAFDNEGPRHSQWLEPFALADRAVTNGDWLAFVDDGGYRRPELWLSDGWAAVQAAEATAPLYWRWDDGGWTEFTLAGAEPLDAGRPVAHVSYYEADAFARWADARLPTEAEWEAVAARSTRGRAQPRSGPPAARDRAARRPRPVRRRLGVDLVGLPAVSRLPAGGRSGR